MAEVVTAICDRWPAYTPDTALDADAQVLAILERQGLITIGLSRA